MYANKTGEVKRVVKVCMSFCSLFNAVILRIRRDKRTALI